MRHPVALSTIFLASVAFCFGHIKAETTDSIPKTWSYTSDYYQNIPPEDFWWKQFNDPLLDSLIDTGIDRNFNVAIAAKRIQLARQALRQAKSGYYPTLGLSAGWTKQRSSGDMTANRLPTTTIDYFSAGIDMSWEIDVFGRITADVKGAKARLGVSKADYVAAMNSLCAEIATTYIQLRTLQAQLRTIDNQLQTQKRVLDIAKARHKSGLNSKLDVAQASTICYSTESQIPSVKSNIISAINSIAVLLGEYPGALDSVLNTESPQPDYFHMIPVGVPLDLIRRRPDIRAAEAQMAAAAAQTGMAKKDFLPRLSLQGTVGFDAHRLGDLFSSKSFGYEIAPKISWTIFDGFSRNASLAEAKENLAIATDSYNLTLITAVEEVNNAMAVYYGELQSINAVEKAVDQAKEEFTLSIDLYKQGLSDFLSVAQAQITLLENSNRLVAAKGNAATGMISIYKALGGGWDILNTNEQ